MMQKNNPTPSLTPTTIALLLTAPLLWAANAVIGRWMHGQVPPLTLNFLRWAIAFVLLCPWGYHALRRHSPLWRYAGRYALLGLLGIGLYNALLYGALQTSTPVNVTLVGSSMPVWMLVVGYVFFRAPIAAWQVVGACLSVSGVVVVLCRGDWHMLLQMKLVVGDLLMLMATIAWAFYSWLLSSTAEPGEIRRDWRAFLLAQMFFGLMWAGTLAGAEQAVTSSSIVWSPWLVGAVLFIAVGPALLAYRCWALAVERAGPTVAGFFANLIPVFTAVLSMLFLNESPQLFHAVAFILIASGIVVSSIRSR